MMEVILGVVLAVALMVGGLVSTYASKCDPAMAVCLDEKK